METRRFNLDLSENSRVSRILKSVFGIICIIVAIILSLMMQSTGESTYSTWIAVAFLFLIGVWFVLKVTGLTDRYVVISESEIVLKDKFYSSALVIKATDLEKVGFSQLKISFFLTGGKVISLRLGTYYRENSFRLMEAVEEFCILNDIPTTGIYSDQERSQS